jgi:hypothetical protein
MTKAKLTNGNIVQLERDCTCITHRNPHWVHMDNLSRLLNQPLFNRLKNDIETNNHHDVVMVQRAISIEEVVRLKEKRLNMERLGIVELFHEPDDETPVHLSNDNAALIDKNKDY